MFVCGATGGVGCAAYLQISTLDSATGKVVRALKFDGVSPDSNGQTVYGNVNCGMIVSAATG